MPRLERATSKFNRTCLDGWNGTGWDTNVSRGTFQTYDRFISDRSFGEKKRIFTIGSANPPLDSRYAVVRAPDGVVYMVESLVSDMYGSDAYIGIYVFHQAVAKAVINAQVSTVLPNNMPGNTELAPVFEAWCDIEKMTSLPAEIGGGRREVEQFWFQEGTDLKEDHVIDVDGALYRPREISKHVRLTYARAERVTSL